MGWRLTDHIPDQKIDEHLLLDEGEQVIDLVRKHWVVYWKAVLCFALGVLMWGFVPFSRVEFGWFPILAGLAMMALGYYFAAAEHRDVVVISTMRVFRASGVLNVRIATMPINRILDITVEKPLLGRLLGYGHFVFESAAQSQGLRDISFISRPDERDLTIQRVVQRAGLRAAVRPAEGFFLD
jgi:hypothetical protein